MDSIPFDAARLAAKVLINNRISIVVTVNSCASATYTRLNQKSLYWANLATLSIYEKLGHCIMQFKKFDWLSGHGI